MIDKLVCMCTIYVISKLPHVFRRWLGECRDNIKFLTKYLAIISQVIVKTASCPTILICFNYILYTVICHYAVLLIFPAMGNFSTFGSPPFSFSNTRDFLRKPFSKRWHGQSGPTQLDNWSPRSCENQSDGLFLGFM